MEPILFKTDNGNCYLYSPSKKALLPIPLDLFDELTTKGFSNSSIWETINQNGYLEPYIERFEGEVNEQTVFNALKNLDQVVFETTTSCNLRCEYCCYGEGYNTFDNRRNHIGHLTFGTAKIIIDYLHSIFSIDAISNAPKEPFAISFYGGEPLMNFNVIKQIVEYAKSLQFRNRTISFTMTTNATLLAKHADFLHSNDFKMLISLDGDRIHDVYRKTHDNHESFDIVIENLEIVRTKFPEWFSTFRYNSVFTNKSNVEEIVKWFKERFFTTPNFSPLHPPTKGSKEYDKVESMIADYEIPEHLRFEAELLGQSPINRRVWEFSNHLFKNLEGTAHISTVSTIPSGTCIPFSKRLFVSYNGQIHPCEKVNREHPLGEIKGNKVIMNLSSIAENFMFLLNQYKPKCQQCYLQSCCTKCILCFNEGLCEDFTSYSKFKNLLSKTISYIEKHPKIIQLLEENIIIK